MNNKSKKKIIISIIAIIICAIGIVEFKTYIIEKNEKGIEIRTTIEGNKNEETQKEENMSEEVNTIETRIEDETTTAEETTTKKVQKVESTTVENTTKAQTTQNYSDPGQYTYPYPSWFEHYWNFDHETGEKIPGSDIWVDPRTKITYYQDGSYCEDGGF